MNYVNTLRRVSTPTGKQILIFKPQTNPFIEQRIEHNFQRLSETNLGMTGADEPTPPPPPPPAAQDNGFMVPSPNKQATSQSQQQQETDWIIYDSDFLGVHLSLWCACVSVWLSPSFARYITC